ncbi:MAG: dihydrolipoyl dehydrogenase [Anaerofustis sp.]
MGQFLFMPKLDMSMEEGTIVQWLIKEGDQVEKGDYVVEVETGKVSIQVDNTIASGTVLKLYSKIGDTVKVNVPIMYIGKQGESIPEPEDLDSMDPISSMSSDEDWKQETVKRDYDLAIIGGGPGGYTCAIRAAQLGKRALIIEKQMLGGVCLNRGCIPTKSFIRNAEVLQTIRNAAQMGISAEHIRFDWKDVITRKNDVVTSLQRGIRVLMKQNGIDVVYGEGEISQRHTVRVGEQSYSCGQIVIATGTVQNAFEELSESDIPVYNTDEILELKQLPETMAIVGAGIIGIEMAYVFNQYGVHVVLIDQNERILTDADHEIVTILEKELKSSGIELMLGRKVIGGKEKELKLDNGESLHVDAVFYTGCRSAVIPSCYESLREDQGYIAVDENLRTSLPGVYAIGDCNGKMSTAHAAIRQGNVLAENLFGDGGRIDYDRIPSCIYSNPEAAWIGLTEEEARARKIPVKVSKTRFASVGKAIASAQTQGLVKVIADSRWDEILGVHIIGANATDIIAQAAITMTAELSADDISNTVFAHPTFSEAFMEACGGLHH